MIEVRFIFGVSVVPGGVSDRGDDSAPGGEPPPDPELLAPL